MHKRNYILLWVAYKLMQNQTTRIICTLTGICQSNYLVNKCLGVGRKKARRINFTKLLVIISLLPSCSTLMFWKDSDSKKEAQSQESDNNEGIQLDIDDQVNIENIELKQARIWARLDELEGTVLKQKQKIKILEKIGRAHV